MTSDQTVVARSNMNLSPYCPGGVNSLAGQGVGRRGPSLGALGESTPGLSRFLEAPALLVPGPLLRLHRWLGQQHPPGVPLPSEPPLRVASHSLPLPLRLLPLQSHQVRWHNPRVAHLKVTCLATLIPSADSVPHG